MLTFKSLRQANTKRLAQFKNRRGGPAHSSVDGSDWTPAQWIGAVVGELGELARVRLRFEAGDMLVSDFEREAKNEIADVQCYLDIAARRMLDHTAGTQDSYAHMLLAVVACLGEYADTRKKFDRGDLAWHEFVARAGPSLAHAKTEITRLLEAIGSNDYCRPVEKVTRPHPFGICLASAVINKFNEVSRRVGARVWLTPSGAKFSVEQPRDVQEPAIDGSVN